MALDLKDCVSQSDNCSDALIYDTTGEYSAANPLGWNNGATALIADVTAATVAIYKRNDDGTYTAAPSSPVNIYTQDYPNLTCTPATITAEDAGYGTDSVWEDGVYKFVLTVTLTTPTVYTYTYTSYPVFTCAIDCCYKQQALKASTCKCNCDGINAKLDTIATYHRTLQSVKDCGNLTAIQDIIDFLTSECGDCGCGCDDEE